MNQVGLVGRITKDPTLKSFSETRNQTSFVIAINRNFRNSQGMIDADFVPCIAWGKLAERIVQYCGKGSLIGVNGRLQSRSYITKEDTKVYTTEVVVDDVRFYALKLPQDSKLSAPKDIAQHFVLPDQQDVVPVP
ncbi:single-stranded DNA-binding protein [Lysinibacillus endophyticus]|uniref:Single-stranded DNA-binding protein n=1 Tax=Ureibacillus endophyticus TaxID=1978490 RepID=A0A494Z5C6_9BACL|nr:single-stranded DNA-binding protein [Lysinibacillus endophyticus]MCP1143640.1 single-stranded DNA-binding protein [Lysinibacillus endophyticus]RKQ17749.1 single-stranded DNA-binding protein [Lysinibacillus endophyticus]